MSKRKGWVLMAVLGTTNAFGAGGSADDLRGQVKAYLNSIDTRITAADWKALGPEAAPILREIATSADTLPLRRARAIEGWSAVGEGDSSWLVDLARTEQEQFLVRRSALVASKARLSQAQFVEKFQPLLQEGVDVRMRQEAGRALIAVSPTRGCAAVQRNVATTRQAEGVLKTLLKKCR